MMESEWMERKDGEESDLMFDSKGVGDKAKLLVKELHVFELGYVTDCWYPSHLKSTGS